MRNLDFPEAGKGAPDVIDQSARDEARVGFPGAHASRPLETIASDDAVVIVSAIGVADSAAIAHDVVQDLTDRFRHHNKGRDRQQGRRKPRHKRPEMDIAGEHHVRRTNAASGRNHALADASRIERDSRCILENSRTRFFGERRESKRIVEWINVKGFPVMHRSESLTVLAGQGSPPPPTSGHSPATASELYLPTFAASAPPRIEIANGNGVVGMAARLGAFLRANGLVDRAMLSNVLPFNISTTVVHYRAGFRGAAEQIVARAPFRMELAAEAGGAVNADIRVVLGHDVRAAGPCIGACERTLKVIAADEAAGPQTASASSDDSFAAAEGFGG